MPYRRHTYASIMVKARKRIKHGVLYHTTALLQPVHLEQLTQHQLQLEGCRAVHQLQLAGCRHI